MAGVTLFGTGPRIFGADHAPEGAALIATNHITEEGLALLRKALGRDAVVLGARDGCVPEADAVAALRAGKPVILAPPGEPARTGALFRLDDRLQRIAASAGCPVVPAWVFEGNAPPLSLPDHSYSDAVLLRPRAEAQVRFGRPLSPGSATIAAVRQSLYELGAECFESREDVAEHLGRAVLRGLKARLFQTVATDAFDNGRSVTGGELLAAGMVFAGWLRAHVREARVGIVLPPGIGALVANLGVVLAAKVPVNLNFTTGAAAAASTIHQSGLRSVITAAAMKSRLADFPWPEHIVDLKEVLTGFGRPAFAVRLALAAALPVPALAALLRIPRHGGDAEATLLFTSGSAGDPKGVILSHRNILGNVLQTAETLQFAHDDRLLACLPVFHSFGLTVTVWYPLCGGPQVVTHVSPLDFARLAEIVRDHRIRLMVTTPTFLRGFLKAAQPGDLKSLQMVVTGAEKLPDNLAEAFEARFGIPVREGYGLTETSPVASVNLTDPKAADNRLAGQSNHRRGSAGRLVPGVAIRITDPEGTEARSLFDTGVLWFRGINIFEGYLGDPERTAAALSGRWFRSGDLGRMDEDGFLYIEGRLARFAKIAGEMVPLATIEQHLHEAFDLANADRPMFVVCRRNHPARGEDLVLLAAIDTTEREVGRRLRDRGLPNLWIPRALRRVAEIPQLASGKLDLRACDEFAAEAS